MTDTLKMAREALAELLEAADSMAGTYCCIQGRHPEEDDTHTHDQWAEDFLQERAAAARAAIAAIDAQQAATVGAPKSALDHMHARCAADVQQAFGDYATTPPAVQAQAQADAWRKLYRRAVNEANGLTNYVDNRPELRHAERHLTAIEAEARALDAAMAAGAAAQGGEHVE